MADRTTQTTAGYCATCGAALRAAAQFCTACGAAVTAAPAAPSRPKAAARRPRKGLWLLLGAGLVVVAVVAVLVLLKDTQQPAASGSAAAIPTVPVVQNAPFPNVARISVEDTHVMAMTGAAVIVDVRDKPFFDVSRIRGALSLPLGELPARYAELPKDKAILLYCT